MLLARFSKKNEVAEPPSRALPVVEPSQQEQSVGSQIVTLEDVDRLKKAGEQVILLDVRTERSRATSDSQADGSVRMPPENVVVQAREKNLPKDAWVVAYCA